MNKAFKATFLGAAFALMGGGLALAAPAAQASPSPLPAYPVTTTLDLGSPNCVTDDVIMNDPLDSTSPITDTYGSVNGINSHATPPVTYSMWYLSPSNVWISGEPPGTQLNTTTGELASYNGTSNSGTWTHTTTAMTGTTVSYTVRDHGQDAVGAKGTTQYQIQVNDSGGGVVTVTYQGNDFNNAGGALTIQLNGGSTTSTSLTLSEIASSLGIPGSSPVKFTFANGGTSYNGWTLSGGSSTAVLTGVSASDPQFKAVTTGTGPGVGPYDEVFFTLSGLSTTSGGVFYLNNDANPCVQQQSVIIPPPPPPPPSGSSYGNNVNKFGNGFDVYQQHGGVANTPIVGWPATQHDPATHFLKEAEGSYYRFEYAPNGVGDGLCVSNPGDGRLVLRNCNANVWQEFSYSGGHIISAFGGGITNPNGTGAQLTEGTSATPWGGSNYTWTAFSSLPA